MIMKLDRATPQCSLCINARVVFEVMHKSGAWFNDHDAYALFWKRYQDYARIYTCKDFVREIR